MQNKMKQNEDVQLYIIVEIVDIQLTGFHIEMYKNKKKQKIIQTHNKQNINID